MRKEMRRRSGRPASARPSRTRLDKSMSPFAGPLSDQPRGNGLHRHDLTVGGVVAAPHDADDDDDGGRRRGGLPRPQCSDGRGSLGPTQLTACSPKLLGPRSRLRPRCSDTWLRHDVRRRQAGDHGDTTSAGEPTADRRGGSGPALKRGNDGTFCRHTR